MSKLTLDEAIKHCLEVAGEQQKRVDNVELIDILDGLDVEACRECAEDHRQLAEWLTDYKKLRSIVDACNILAADAFAVEKLCKELKEAKRLLKSAISEWPFVCEWGECGEHCEWYVNGQCSQEWSGKAEALTLIGEDGDIE